MMSGFRTLLYKELLRFWKVSFLDSSGRTEPARPR